MSRKIASNDKTLESINNRMDSFTSAIKNQLSFNKMVESQISQLAASVPMAEKGKISGNLDELETTNIVHIFNAREYFIAPPRPLRLVWVEEDMLENKGGRPVIPICIGAHTFDEAICDLGASVNIMPNVIYEKIHGQPLLYTTMCLQQVDQTLCYPKGILENVLIGVGHSALRLDSVVIEIGGDERALIILGRPFLSIAKAIIYADTTKIYFTIGNTKERFSFKHHTLTN